MAALVETVLPPENPMSATKLPAAAPPALMEIGPFAVPPPDCVVALAWFDGTDSPLALTAVTRKKKVVDALRPVLEKLVPVTPVAMRVADDMAKPEVVLR